MANFRLEESKLQKAEKHYVVYQSKDRECLFQGFEHWDVEKSASYKPVCFVNVEGGLQLEDGSSWKVDNLEQVFKLLNGYYYDEDSEDDFVYDAHVGGYAIREGHRKDGSYYCFRDMHSLSVGDVVVDYNDDHGIRKAYIVDSFGFKEIDFVRYHDAQAFPQEVA